MLDETLLEFGDIVSVKCSKIHPPHEVRNLNKLRRIRENMEENGWVGRPLLIEELDCEYYALTGSHRLAAAKQLDDMSVPAIVITHEEAIFLFGVAVGLGFACSLDSACSLFDAIEHGRYVQRVLEEATGRSRRFDLYAALGTEELRANKEEDWE